MPVRLPKEIIFKSPPGSIISISAGQIGYKRTTRIRLKIDKDTKRRYFRTKHGVTYVESPKSKKTFILKDRGSGKAKRKK